MEGKNGFIHLHIGNGKGKTTAAVGMAIRAAGWGMKVLFCQFLKSTKTGEIPILESLKGQVTVFRPFMRHKGFLWEQSADDLAQTAEDIETGWLQIMKMIAEGPYELIILDEILDAVKSGFIDVGSLIGAISGKAADIVLTGREAPESIILISDYVTNMSAVKHPYISGITSRKGIEY